MLCSPLFNCHASTHCHPFSASFCHPERSEGSQHCRCYSNALIGYAHLALRFFASLRSGQNDNAVLTYSLFGRAVSGCGLLSLAVGSAGRISSPPIIGATCVFDAKIYKIVDSFFDVSPCFVWNKNFFQISDFSFQLPSLLVEN
jgi:hypothetical protein